MIRKAQSGERKHVCKVCGKGFKTKQYLKIHNNVHTGEKIVCDVEGCTASFSQRSGMNLHKRVKHMGVQHECPECGKMFGWKGAMTRHYKTHEDQRDFKCPTCGVEFTQKGDLEKHIKTV